MNPSQFSPSYGLIASLQGLPTSIIEEIYENLTPENVQEFLDVLSGELASRQDQE